jgi:hypothetical protein
MRKLLLLLLLSFPAFASDRFWVGGTGNWSDAATHWAASSGGAPNAAYTPTSVDRVFFDASSFTGAAQVVTIDGAAYCKGMDWLGATNTPTLAGVAPLTIAGVDPGAWAVYTFRTIAAMAWTHTGTVYILNTVPFPGNAPYLTTGGLTMAASFVFTIGSSIFAKVNGGFATTGDITIDTGRVEVDGVISCGTFTLGRAGSGYDTSLVQDIAGRTLTCSRFVSYYTGPGSTNFVQHILTTSGNVDASGVTAGLGGMTLIGTSPATLTISGTLISTYVTVSGGPKVITISAGGTIQSSFFNVAGTAGNLVTLQSSSPGTPWYFVSVSTRPTCDYLVISDSSASRSGDPAGLLAGDHSTAAGGNTGWIFAAVLAGHNAPMLSADF